MNELKKRKRRYKTTTQDIGPRRYFELNKTKTKISSGNLKCLYVQMWVSLLMMGVVVDELFMADNLAE